MNYSDSLLAYNYFTHGDSIGDIAAHFSVTVDDVHAAIEHIQSLNAAHCKRMGTTVQLHN